MISVVRELVEELGYRAHDDTIADAIIVLRKNCIDRAVKLYCVIPYTQLLLVTYDMARENVWVPTTSQTFELADPTSLEQLTGILSLHFSTGIHSFKRWTKAKTPRRINKLRRTATRSQ